MSRIELIQGSKEWLEYRSSHITATDIGSIMALNPFKSAIALFEEKIGLRDVVITDKMKAGSEMESVALQQFIEETKLNVKPAVLVSDSHPFLMASVDGISDDGKHLVEIKCGKRAYKEAILGIIASYYNSQMQAQLFVCELDEMSFYCFNGTHGILQIVHRDQEFIDKMLIAAEKFYDNLINLREPVIECEIFNY